MNVLLLVLPNAVFFVALMLLTLRAERASRAAAMEDRAAKRGGFGLEYFLGSRSLSGVVLAMTLTATYGSVSSFVSGPGVAWQLGLGWVVFAAPQMLAGFFLLGLLGRKTALLSRAFNAVTVVDLIRARYASKTLAVLSALALLLFFTVMIAGQFVGGAAVLATTTGLPHAAGLLVFGGLTVLYTAFGGFRAVAVTDTLCAVLMVAGMLILGGELLSLARGWDAFTAGIASASTLNASGATGAAGSFMTPDAGGLLPWPLLLSAWVLVGFGTAGLPQSIVRAMSYRTSADLHQAIRVGTLVCGALMIGMTFIGVLARGVVSAWPEGLPTTDHLIPYVLTQHMNPFVAGVTLIGPLAATMSTVSSLLIAAASAVVHDLLKLTGPEVEDVRVKRIARFGTGALGVAALLIALDPPSIVAWINLAAFGGLELTFLIPFVGGLYWRRASAAGAVAAIVSGLLTYGALLLVKPDLGGWHPVVPAFVVEALVFAAFGVLNRKPLEGEAARFFPRG